MVSFVFRNDLPALRNNAEVQVAESQTVEKILKLNNSFQTPPDSPAQVPRSIRLG
jgi:hypothetical protein